MTHATQIFSRRDMLAVAAGVAVVGLGTFATLARAEDAVPVVAAAEPAAGAKEPAVAPTRAVADLGVELTAVRLAASDFLIDVRYRVKDPAKAQPLLERKLRPVLVNEATGDRFYVPQAPKVGELRQSASSKQPAIEGRVYFVLFANPDRKLKSGEKVTLYAGDSVVKDLVVQ
jgi:hypothetical protein